MDESDGDLVFWRLCDELNLNQAALLLIGKSPAEWRYVEDFLPHERPSGYEATKSSLINALRGGRITGVIVPEEDCIMGSNVPFQIPGSISAESRICVESLREWLISRGMKRGFFFPAESDTPGYLNPNDARYAPKLAAAVCAWQAVTNPVGKHPKQALTKWLLEHAAEFGMTDHEGKPNETGIEEVAKVANWKPAGGAPKTPAPKPRACK